MPKTKTSQKPAAKSRAPANKRRVAGSVASSSPFSARKGLVFAILFALIGCFAVFQSFANPNENSFRAFEDKPERGLVWAGLRSGKGDSLCGKLLEVVNQAGEATGCTHGPDPAPEGVDVRKSAEPLTASEIASTDGSQSAGLFECEGDGQSGYRVQVIYARSSDRADRFPTYASSFPTYAANASAMFERSAQQTGDSRKVRFVTDASCNIDIKQVVMTPTGDDTFSNTTTELKNQGFNRIDRKYMIWVDATVYCGIGTIWSDDKPTQDNLNNGNAATYGRTDAGCWNRGVESHELMHNLGGVQLSAPNTSGGWHCTDESDRMCYDDDDTGPVTMRSVCASDQESYFDCQKDDYFNTRPPAGSYLATKWNSANSRFLIGSTPVTPSDTTPPAVQLTAPANGSTLSNTITVTASASDNVGVSRVDFLLNGNLVQSDSTASYAMPLDTTRYTNGSYQISARAYDAAGNSSASSVHTVTISNTSDIDTIMPTVSISSPLANSTVPANGRVSIAASATDNRAVTKMEVYVDGRLTTTTTSGTVNTSWNAKRAASGYHTIMVKAFDAAGNVAQSQVNVFKS